ncbi:MAG: META domain-containing protein [Rhodoferax sp.]|nr:META domain-containing protein [Rhodoferax sp.]
MFPNRPHVTVCSLLLAALLSACAVPTPVASPTTVAPTPASLAGTEWVAFAIDGVAEVTNPKPKLRWVSADKLAGTGGCNGFTAPVVVAQGGLRLGALASTGRACLSMPGSQEDLFFKALELTRKARVERDQLVLTDEAGKQLARFLKTR